jgi:SulP family sulfate permease
VLAATFFLTIFRDLTEAIIVGFALGSVLFIHRMSQATAVETRTPFVGEDMADSTQPRGEYDEALAANPEVVVYRITGAFFFGAAASIASVLDRIQDTHKALIVDFSAVPFLDSTGANVMEGLAHKAARRGVALYVAGANPDIRRALLTHGVRPPAVLFATSAEDALDQYREQA